MNGTPDVTEVNISFLVFIALIWNGSNGYKILECEGRDKPLVQILELL